MSDQNQDFWPPKRITAWDLNRIDNMVRQRDTHLNEVDLPEILSVQPLKVMNAFQDGPVERMTVQVESPLTTERRQRGSFSVTFINGNNITDPFTGLPKLNILMSISNPLVSIGPAAVTAISTDQFRDDNIRTHIGRMLNESSNPRSYNGAKPSEGGFIRSISTLPTEKFDGNDPSYYEIGVNNVQARQIQLLRVIMYSLDDLATQYRISEIKRALANNEHSTIELLPKSWLREKLGELTFSMLQIGSLPKDFRPTASQFIQVDESRPGVEEDKYPPALGLTFEDDQFAFTPDKSDEQARPKVHTVIKRQESFALTFPEIGLESVYDKNNEIADVLFGYSKWNQYIHSRGEGDLIYELTKSYYRSQYQEFTPETPLRVIDFNNPVLRAAILTTPEIRDGLEAQYAETQATVSNDLLIYSVLNQMPLDHARLFNWISSYNNNGTLQPTMDEPLHNDILMPRDSRFINRSNGKYTQEQLREFWYDGIWDVADQVRNTETESNED